MCIRDRYYADSPKRHETAIIKKTKRTPPDEFRIWFPLQWGECERLATRPWKDLDELLIHIFRCVCVPMSWRKSVPKFVRGRVLYINRVSHRVLHDGCGRSAPVDPVILRVRATSLHLVHYCSYGRECRGLAQDVHGRVKLGQGGGAYVVLRFTSFGTHGLPCT